MADPIGTIEKDVVKEATTVWTWLKTAIQDVWKWLMSFTQFLDDPRNNKFSHKRLIAVACTIVALRQFIIKDWFAGVILLGAAVILAVISAVTRT